jgi:hypothetical protein
VPPATDIPHSVAAALGGADPRQAASLMAVERAFAWYLEEAAVAKAPPVSRDDAALLREALGGRKPWRPEYFDRLVTFAQAMHRLAPMDASIPTCNLGDCLTALNRVDIAADAERWRFEGKVDGEVFAKLEFRETSLGIAKAQREHREGWWAHGEKNRAFIEQAAATVERPALAVALGAGQPFDLPLASLARRFERLVLIDIDADALAETAESVRREVPRANLETRTLDLTGINAALVARIEAAFAASADADGAVQALMRLARSYRLPAPPQMLETGERADLLVSSCVLTQLAWPQRVFAERLFEQRFGAMGASVDTVWSTAWTELGLRVQQDHVNALGEASVTSVLTSDVFSHQTVWDARTGSERAQGKKIFPLAAESLLERVPRLYKVGAQAKWKWSRYKASKKGSEGSTMDVEGVVLNEPRSAGGLWLPG